MPKPANAPATALDKHANVAEFSVSELATAIKRTLEGAYGYVRLRGEISGYRGPHSSGHCYFSLKDEKAKIEAVIWRGVFSSLRFKPEEGMEVIASGKITTFPGSSKYQIVIESLEPAGVGALMALLEERKRKFAAEGLFTPERKRPLPFLPAVVGIITSPTGAVIRDMLHGFNERFPTRVLVWPVRVQGETSAAEVAAAVRGFNALSPGGPIPRPDVLIVARGGGSLEDLWGFNEEVVVRAVADSRIPVISAVGHETDWTLIDLVADARAPTPTKAAEWAVPKHSELLERTRDFGMRLVQSWRRLIEENRSRLGATARGLPTLSELLALPRQRFDTAAGRLDRGLVTSTQGHANRYARTAGRFTPQLVAQKVLRARDRLDALARHCLQTLARGSQRHRTRFERVSGRLQPGALENRVVRGRERLAVLDARALQAFGNIVQSRRGLLEAQTKVLSALSYQSVLERGFALVRDEAGVMVRSVAGIAAGARLEIEVADGRIKTRAEEAGPVVGGTTDGGDKDGDPRTATPRPWPAAPSRTAAMPPRPRIGKTGSGGQGSLF